MGPQTGPPDWPPHGGEGDLWLCCLGTPPRSPPKQRPPKQRPPRAGAQYARRPAFPPPHVRSSLVSCTARCTHPSLGRGDMRRRSARPASDSVVLQPYSLPVCLNPRVRSFHRPPPPAATPRPPRHPSTDARAGSGLPLHNLASAFTVIVCLGIIFTPRCSRSPFLRSRLSTPAAAATAAAAAAAAPPLL